MIGGLFQSTTIPALQETAAFAEARHSVLAGNIANLDTPGYRTRDLSVSNFQETLKEAIEAQRKHQATPQPRIMTTDTRDPMAKARATANKILFHDEGDVTLEHQVKELSKNQFQHTMAIALMNAQFRLLQAAISEQV